MVKAKNALRAWLFVRKKTAKGFAKEMLVSRNTVHKWLRNECQPHKDKQLRICESLSITWEQLYHDPSTPFIITSQL